MNFKYSVFCLTIAVLLLASCAQRKNRDAEIKKLLELDLKMDSALMRLDTLNLADIQQKVQTVKTDLKELEMGYRGTMATEDAFNMDKYKNIYHMYKRFKLGEVEKDITTTKIQLNNLKDLISSEATEDKNGNVIDDHYIDGAFNLEVKYVDNLLKEIDEIDKRRPRFYEHYNRMKPYVDSLKMQMPTKE